MRPNILLLLGDDIDRDSLGPWGGQAHTPHLDQLAADGMRFDRVYANVAMCGPFRQELYSGCSAWRTRALPNHSHSKPNTKSLPHYLRPLGYMVGLLGKSHVGPSQAYPFDKVGSLPMREDANPKAVELAHAYFTKARNAGKPFCLVVAAHDAHGPYTHGDVNRYKPEALRLPKDAVDTREYRNNFAKHLAEVTNLDALLGDLRAVLSEEGLTDNTLVVFSSEQGNSLPFAKWTCFDDGLASGLVAALPGVVPAGKSCDQLFWISDVAPTFLEAAGGSVNQGQFDGKSQWANFKGADETVHEYAYGAFLNCNIIDNRDRIFPIRSIRDGRFTLIWSPRAGSEVTSNTTLTQALKWIETGEGEAGANVAASWVAKQRDSPSSRRDKLVKRLHHRPEWALYDRKHDPEELDNLIEHPEWTSVRKRMEGALMQWLKRWGDADPIATERSFLKKKR